MLDKIKKARVKILQKLSTGGGQNQIILFFRADNEKNVCLNGKHTRYYDINNDSGSLAEFNPNLTKIYFETVLHNSNYTPDLAVARLPLILDCLEFVATKITGDITETFLIEFWQPLKAELAGVMINTREQYILIDLVKEVVNCSSIYNITDKCGFYFNPFISTNQTLYFYKQGFKKAFVKECRSCGKQKFVNLYGRDIGHELTEIIRNGRKELYCENCLENQNYGVCDICGNKHFRSYYTLNPVMARTLNRRASETIKICSDCFNNRFRACGACGEITTRLIATRNNGLCEKCKNGIIHSYGYKPQPRFKKLAVDDKIHNELYFGIEIELESNAPRRSDLAEIVNRRLGNFAYCKNDGSLRTGFEIVTEPMSYNFILKKSAHIKEVMQELINAGAYSYKAQNTGLHIHISKNAFESVEHLAKFASCFYLQKHFTEFIALRQFQYYCLFNEKYKNYKYFCEKLTNLSSTLSDNRYNAINLQNRNTVEVRIFKGNLKTETILMYIQFCLAVFQYTQKLPSNKKPKVDELKEWIKKYKKGYEYLKARTAAFEVSDFGSLSSMETKSN